MKLFTTLFAATLAIGMSLPLQAEPVAYEFDPVHSQIIFKVNHLGYSNSYGKFRSFEGELLFDADDWSASSTQVTIHTKSIDLDNKKWNEHMRSSDLLDVEQFPTMTFKSTKLVRTDDNRGQLHGELTLLGKTLPIVLDLTLNQAGIHPMTEQPHVGFSATGSLQRSEFGMVYGVPAVADRVDIIIEVEASAK